MEMGIEWDTLDEELKDVLIAGNVGEKESLETLELLEEILRELFQASEFGEW
jgi:hypothetical protein